jgi:hypothetical protein
VRSNEGERGVKERMDTEVRGGQEEGEEMVKCIERGNAATRQDEDVRFKNCINFRGEEDDEMEEVKVNTIISMVGTEKIVNDGKMGLSIQIKDVQGQVESRVVGDNLEIYNQKEEKEGIDGGGDKAERKRYKGCLDGGVLLVLKLIFGKSTWWFLIFVHKYAGWGNRRDTSGSEGVNILSTVMKRTTDKEVRGDELEQPEIEIQRPLEQHGGVVQVHGNGLTTGHDVGSWRDTGTHSRYIYETWEENNKAGDGMGTYVRGIILVILE